MVYKLVHTGPNSQLGGLKDGLFKPAYQFGISAMVKIPPREPIPMVAINEMINFCVLLIFMIWFYDS